jgi:hypothetical protein
MTNALANLMGGRKMSLFGQPGGSRKTVSEKDVKLCALCGALNHHKNAECFTCGWRGVFDEDESTIHMAWQRILDQHECVEMEHITGSRSYSIGELGTFNGGSSTSTVRGRIKNWWRGVMARRDARAAERERHLRPQAYPPNELGV